MTQSLLTRAVLLLHTLSHESQTAATEIQVSEQEKDHLQLTIELPYCSDASFLFLLNLPLF